MAKNKSFSGIEGDGGRMVCMYGQLETRPDETSLEPGRVRLLR